MLQIRNEVAAELCIDTQHKGADDPFGMAECIKDNPGKTGEQVCYSFVSVILLLLTKLTKSPVWKLTITSSLQTINISFYIGLSSDSFVFQIAVMTVIFISAKY